MFVMVDYVRQMTVRCLVSMANMNRLSICSCCWFFFFFYLNRINVFRKIDKPYPLFPPPPPPPPPLQREKKSTRNCHDCWFDGGAKPAIPFVDGCCDGGKADLPTPKYFCLYSKQPMSVFSNFWPDYCADAPTNQSKRSSVNGQFFYHSSCKSSVWTRIFSDAGALRSDDFTLFTSAKVILDWRPQNTFSKNNAPCVLLSLMPMGPFLHGCCLVRVCFLSFVHSSSSSLVSCRHLSQTASNRLYRKMANFRKVSMQNRCSLV